jgi:uncharacterized membrane protein YhhN
LHFPCFEKSKMRLALLVMAAAARCIQFKKPSAAAKLRCFIARVMRLLRASKMPKNKRQFPGILEFTTLLS